MTPTLVVSKKVDISTEADVRASGRSLFGAASAPGYDRASGIGDNILFAAKLTINCSRLDGAKVCVATSVRLIVAIQGVVATYQVEYAFVTPDG